MSANDMATTEHQRISQSSSGNSNNNHNPLMDSQFQLEFWKSLLATTTAAAATAAPFNPAGAAPMLPHQQEPQSQLLQPPSINTGIRLPPAFNLTATIQHLLRASTPSSPASAAAFPVNNAALLLQHALFGQQQMAQIGVKKEEEEDAEEEENVGGIDLEQEEMGEGGTDSPEEGRKSGQIIGPICVKMEAELEGTAAINDPSQTPSSIQESATNGERSQQQQQRRPRIGGSSAKTAEVWRFFSQRPNGEQAATCSICQKTIKATNSSTTGMIRHLRSCHHAEFVILQHARTLKVLKNADDTVREQMLRQLGYDRQPEATFEMIQAALESSLSVLQSPMESMAAPTMVPKHSVEALINGIGGGGGGGNGMVALENKDHSQMQSSPAAMISTFASQLAQLPAEQRQLLEQIENFKTSRPTSIERQQKKEQQQIEELQKQGGGGGKRMATNDEEEAGGTKGGKTVDSALSSSATAAGNGGIFREPKRRKEESASVGAAGAGGMTPKGTTLNGKKSRKSTTTTATTTTVKTMTIGKAENVEKENGTTITKEMASDLEKHSTRISEQMAAMFLVDKTEFLLDRAAFRQFIQSIMPNYQMPSSEHFRKEIIPRVQRQLEQLAMFREEFHRNNPFGLSPPSIGLFHPHPLLNNNNINSSSSSSSSSSSNSNQYSLISPFFSTPSSISNNNSVISPSSSAEESGYHEEESPPSTALANTSDNIGHGQHPQQAQIHHQTLAKEKSLDVEELAQMAAIRSQNGSFTYSIDLNPLNGDGASGTGAQ